jgi:hypothetical protein
LGQRNRRRGEEDRDGEKNEKNADSEKDAEGDEEGDAGGMANDAEVLHRECLLTVRVADKSAQ